MARLATALVALFLVAAPTSYAFAPATGAFSTRLGLRSNAAARRARAAPAKMSLDSSVVEGAQAVLAAVQNVPFTDELTGEAQGFTAPLNHFLSVLGLWALFALPVWSAAYKQAGAQNPEWTGASHVREDIPGLGLVTRAAPEWDGPTFGEGLAYVFSFFWKPPILIAWRPREDLVVDAMDPARDTVVSKLYKGLGGASDKAAYYDEEDQLLIKSEIQIFEETPLGKRREALAEKNGWYEGNPSFGRSYIEFNEVTKKNKGVAPGKVQISASELAALKAAAAARKK